MDEAHALCDRVGIMDQGKLIALGTPRELVASLGAEHVVEFALADGAAHRRRRCCAALPGVRDVRRDEAHRALCRRPSCTSPCRRCSICCASGSATLSQLSTHSATLEDVFVSLTGRHLRDELTRRRRVAIRSSSSRWRGSASSCASPKRCSGCLRSR